MNEINERVMILMTHIPINYVFYLIKFRTQNIYGTIEAKKVRSEIMKVCAL